MQSMAVAARTQEHLRYAQQSSAAHRENDDISLDSLIGLIVQGDETALARLYDATIGRVYALAKMIVRNTADAEEVACDTYTQVWRTAARYASSRGSVMGWLLMICRSRALDLLRQRKISVELNGEEEISQDHAESSPEDLLDYLIRGAATHDALNSLSPLRRQLIGMAFLQEMSHEEIAGELSLPIGTVKSHIRRGLVSMRECLAVYA